MPLIKPHPRCRSCQCLIRKPVLTGRVLCFSCAEIGNEIRRLTAKDRAKSPAQRAVRKAYKASNREAVIAEKAARRARTRQSTPLWANRRALVRFYLGTPEGYHVDHIVPLAGITPEGWRVSGLHVEYNLQYLTAAENVEKSNQMRPHEATIGRAAPVEFAQAA